MPIGLVSEDAMALGRRRCRSGREREIADLLSFMKRAGIGNTVWLTADMHYTAAHRYDPNRAVFQDFEPFWEFVSGPLHAGTWGPAPLDNTFGPRGGVRRRAAAKAQGENLAPCFGLQFFGRVDIDGQIAGHDGDLEGRRQRDLWSVRYRAAAGRAGGANAGPAFLARRATPIQLVARLPIVIAARSGTGSSGRPDGTTRSCRSFER